MRRYLLASDRVPRPRGRLRRLVGDLNADTVRDRPARRHRTSPSSSSCRSRPRARARATSAGRPTAEARPGSATSTCRSTSGHRSATAADRPARSDAAHRPARPQGLLRTQHQAYEEFQRLYTCWTSVPKSQTPASYRVVLTPLATLLQRNDLVQRLVNKPGVDSVSCEPTVPCTQNVRKSTS